MTSNLDTIAKTLVDVHDEALSAAQMTIDTAHGTLSFSTAKTNTKTEFRLSKDGGVENLHFELTLLPNPAQTVHFLKISKRLDFINSWNRLNYFGTAHQRDDGMLSLRQTFRIDGTAPDFLTGMVALLTSVTDKFVEQVDRGKVRNA